MNVLYIDFRRPARHEITAAGWFFMPYLILLIGALAWWLK